MCKFFRTYLNPMLPEITPRQYSRGHNAIVCLFFTASYQVRSTLYLVRATSVKLGLYAGKTKFNTHNEEKVTAHVITCMIVLVYLLYIKWNKNILVAEKS
jgi:hypothetical protein